MALPEQTTEPWAQALDYMYVADHEIETAIALLFDGCTEPLTYAQLARKFAAAQGEDPAWVFPDNYTYPERTCHLNLAPGGVVQLAENGKGWQTKKEYDERTFALGGLFASWGLENTASMQDVLPATTMYNEPPQIYFEIYWALAGYPPLPAHLQKISNKGAPIGRLESLGIVTREPQANTDIVVVTQSGRRLRCDGAAERNAIIRVVRELEGGQRFMLQELVDRAMNKGYYTGQPDRLYTFIRNSLERSSERSVSGLRIAENNADDSGPLTGFSIAPAMIEPIKDILAGVKSIAEGEQSEINYYARAARRVLDDPLKFKALVQKGRQSSSRTRKDPD